MGWWFDAGVVHAAAAAVLTWVVMRWLHPFATRLNLLDFPEGRKDHAHPTPITGGLAMLVAFGLVGVVSLGSHASSTLVSFIAAAALLVAVGLYDDRHDLRWYWRILAQVVAALIMVYGAGVRVEQLGAAFGAEGLSLGYLAVPFTVFATVGIINAVNMVDGADGLAGLLVVAALVMLTGASLYAGNAGLARHALMVAGAVGAFLLYNMRFPWQRRAKAFMGNAGSAFLGLVIAWVMFRLTQNASHPVNPVLALWLVPVPIMDCLVLTARRLREGRSPFAAGRDHIHHFMIDAGFGPTQAAMTLTVATFGIGLTAGQAMRMDVPHPVLLGAFLLLCAFWYWLTSNRMRAINALHWVRSRAVFGDLEGAPAAQQQRADGR